MTIKSLYEILEINEDASNDDIRKAYLRLALKYHPDKNKGESDNFKEIREAYEILSDPFKRKIYIDSANKNIDVTNWKSFINDVFFEMYVYFINNINPKNIEFIVNIPLDDIYFKRVKKLNIRVKRWIDNKYTDYTQIIYINLNNYTKQYTFKDVGDESISPFHKYTSDIIININIIDIPENVYIQDIISDYDIYVKKELTLYDYYNLEVFDIHICKDVILQIVNTRDLDYIIKENGLPFIDKLNFHKRADIYIKFEISIPKTLPDHDVSNINNILFQHFS